MEQSLLLEMDVNKIMEEKVIDIRLVILILLSALMLTVVRIILAYLSKKEYFSSDLDRWIDNNTYLLKLSDELLAISSVLFGSYIVLIVLDNIENSIFSISIIIISLIFCLVCWIGIILLIGNLVYPVNGLKLTDSSGGYNILVQIYSRLHLADLSLGLLTIFLSNLSNNQYVLYSGYIVGCLQIAFTYYSRSIKIISHITSIVLWFVWIIIFQWYY